MNRTDERLHALKVERKEENVRICAERDQRMRQLDVLIMQVCELKEIQLPEVAKALRELKRMLATDAHRRLSRNGRVYQWRINEVIAAAQS